MSDTVLLEMVTSTKLEPVEQTTLLQKFEHFSEIAEIWKAEAETIIVTDGSQTKEMARAREGRLVLADKRISIERTRKSLKEESLRKGQAIDRIAKYLTGLIEPIEKYLGEQERFVELKAAREAKERAEKERTEREAREAEEVRKKAEEEAKERQRLREENERQRVENERLRKEKAEADRIAAEERKTNEEKLRNERMKTETAERDRKKAEDDARKGRERIRIIQTRKNEEISELKKENIILKKLTKCPKCGHEFKEDL